MDAIYQTTFSNAFYWMPMHKFPLRFHWSLFPRVKLTISTISSDNGLAPTRRQAIFWTNDGKFTDAHMCHSTSMSWKFLPSISIHWLDFCRYKTNSSSEHVHKCQKIAVVNRPCVSSVPCEYHLMVALWHGNNFRTGPLWVENRDCRWFATPWRSCDVTVMPSLILNSLLTYEEFGFFNLRHQGWRFRHARHVRKHWSFSSINFKLELYGVQDIALKWFDSYLSNRLQYVTYNNV